MSKLFRKSQKTRQGDLPSDFDGSEYLRLNPDLQKAGIDPAAHYLAHGKSEGRKYRLSAVSDPEAHVIPADFDPQEYLELHEDVKEAGFDPATHYLKHGQAEGRPYKKTRGVEGAYDQDGLRSVHNHDFIHEPRFQRAYARSVQAAGGEDYQWHWRVHIGLWAASVALNLQGDFVECGVNKGCMSTAIMEYLDWNSCGKKFYLLDTFSGIDERYAGEADLSHGVAAKNEQALASGFYTSDVESVRRNFAEWEKHVEIIEGPIPETLKRLDSQEIAFLHLDLNNSAPEIAAISFLWDRLVPGAPILLDDYAYCGFLPQKTAMDEFAKDKSVVIASLPTGQGLILKPGP